MAELNRDLPVLSMGHSELAERIQRTFINGYAKLVQRGEEIDLNAAVQGFAALLVTSVEAMEKAEQAASAAKSVRLAIIRCQVAAGMTMEDIGAVHGLTRQRISQLLRSEPEYEPIIQPKTKKAGKKRKAG